MEYGTVHGVVDATLSVRCELALEPIELWQWSRDEVV
jgi:hypothetical protein